MQKILYSLTNPQKSIWFTEEFYKGTPIENITGSVIIPEKVNFSLLEQAINIFVEKNDSFRLKFIIEGQEVKQFVDSYSKFPIEIIDVSSNEDLQKVEQETASTVFNVLGSFLYVFKIVRFPDGHGGFIINMHHLISDAWSAGLGGSEIIKIYTRLLKKEDIKDIVYPSYIDYINSEKAYMESDKFSKDKSFWNLMFDSVPEIATIPSSDAFTRNNLSGQSNRKQFTMSKNLISIINEFCKNAKVSVFNFFMAVFAIYIGRTSGLDEFVIGSPILNRCNVKEKRTSGMFINTVPLKIELKNNIKFTDLASSVSTSLFNIFKHQKYPYLSLLEDLRHKDHTIPNLYNILISYQNIRSTAQNSETPYSIQWIPNNYTSDSIDIHIYDMNDTGDINIAYDYQIIKYSEQDIVNIHSRILNIIDQILENTTITINDIEIVTPEEKNRILIDFNNTTTDYPRNNTISSLFEEQAQKTPDNIAVVFEKQKLTYKELNEKSNSLAIYLRNAGVANNDVVGIFLDKSLESIIAILGILKCGAIYMPIDINYPDSRIDFMLKDSSASFILSSLELRDKLKRYNNVIYIDLSNAEIYDNLMPNLDPTTSSDDCAYIMYTSGSTGNPKGVMVSNRNIARLVKNTNYIKFEKHERILQTGSIVFDACTFEIWGALLNGFELYIIKKQDLLDPILLEKYLIDNKITILWLTAPLFNQLSESKPDMFRTVRVLLTGGDVLSPKHINAVKKYCPNLTIINGYGPTENTTFSTCFTIDKYYEDSIPIGFPIANSTCYIVSPTLKLLPIGVSGELLVGGDGVSRGYLNNAQFTAKKFISNPFGSGKLYKTGDLAKWLPDGSIDFIGRVDNQVKVRGFRVELNEITLRIHEFANIKECITLVKTINNEKVICSYFSANHKIETNALRAWLTECLPHYAIPSYLIQLDILPINANGKVDIKKLPEPRALNAKSEIILPRNEFDTKLIELLKNLLNINEISIDDNFLELGGDSLSSINLCIQIQNEFNIQLFVKDILEHPVISELSDQISAQTNKYEQIDIKPAPEMTHYPLSSAQKRMYISSAMVDGESTIYNIPGGIILDKMPDIDKLENCLNTLIARHDSLRTYFEPSHNDIVQKVQDSIIFKLDICNEVLPYNKLEQKFEDFIRPFDLSKAPLFRAMLIKLEDNKVALFIDIHHIISDGTSLDIFIDELCKLYNNQSLDHLKLTYKDFAVWENSRISSGDFDKAEDFWLKQFKDNIPILNMPTSYPRPATRVFSGSKVHAEFDEETTTRINTTCKKLGVTPYMFLLSVYYILLSKYSSQNDIVVGTPIVGRSVADLYHIIGMFVNTLPIRAYVDSALSFKDFLTNIKNICLEDYKYQDYPFDELVNKLNIQRVPNRNPLFDVMFIYQSNGRTPVNFGGINAKYYIPDTKISKFDLSLEIIPENNVLKLSFEYATKLFKQSFVENLSKHYLNIINAVLDNLDVKLSSINMLSESEKEKILNDFNNTDIDFKSSQTIAETFEAQVIKHPDNIAIVFENSKITYAELNSKANSLAHALKKTGIATNDVVGIMLNRSLEMISSILAVLKSGGTYFLIDTTLPSHRIKYMLTNSEAKLLILDKDYGIDFDNQLNISDFDYSKNTCNLKCNKELSDSFAIIYTSGSTGNPKGVLLQEKGLINLINAFNQVMKIENFSNQLGLSSVSFDMFAVELYSSILLGRTLYLLSDEEIKNPILTSKIIIKNKIEFLITTPTKIELLLSNPTTSECLKVLKAFQLGGEVFTSTLYEKLTKYTNAKIYNGYGPTEITACCSNKLVTSKNNINIGSPIPNTKIYILDNNMNPCPIGVPGELCVAGLGVSLGYINDKAKTDKAFVNAKFTDTTLYKTGDMARFLENGEIEYIGRNDFQVKLNGLRIELSEIEKKFLAIKEVENCVVLCDKSKTFLKAFFTATDTLSIPAIRKKLLESLPTYMVPKYIFQIEQIPITSNGKVDRKALDELNTDICEENIKYVAPITDTQKLFCKIWEEILETKVGIDNDLFELGADSLSAIKFKVEALNNNLDVPYSDIFTCKTIRKLSESKAEENVTTPIENFNYDNINIVLRKNKKQLTYKIKNCKNNNVLLLGSNGFVGMHIINSFIQNDSGTIYCVMRDKNGKGSLNRFLDVLHFYFGNSLDRYVGNRIIVLKGDIVKEKFGLSNHSYENIISNVSTIINAAANVKHFGNFDKFKSINIDTIKHTIEFCKRYSKRLIHLSTLSISGNMFLDGSISRDTLKNNKKVYFAENNLFIHQSLDNVYTRSKFEAEKIILDDISNGLDAQILRLGNITSRASDGKFQINPENNAFTNRLKSFVILGLVPKSLLKQEIEFTAVDLCSDAIIKILQNKSTHISVLHLYNRNHITGGKIFKAFEELGTPIKAVSDSAFMDFINQHLSEKSVKDSITGIVNDFNTKQKISYSTNTFIKSDFSVDFLSHCKFKWNKINNDYIVKYINYLKSINFFDNN